jgi:hypothetical protein
MTIPFLETPNFRDSEAASHFDRNAFALNSSLRAFVRRGSPHEYPAGKFEQMCPPSKQLLKLVIRKEGSRGLALGYLRPLTERPEDFCASLENERVVNEMILRLTGGDYGRN